MQQQTQTSSKSLKRIFIIWLFIGNFKIVAFPLLAMDRPSRIAHPFSVLGVLLYLMWNRWPETFLERSRGLGIFSIAVWLPVRGLSRWPGPGWVSLRPELQCLPKCMEWNVRHRFSLVVKEASTLGWCPPPAREGLPAGHYSARPHVAE